MQNFSYCNPVNIIFGKGTISELSNLLPKEGRILLAYGGGSIKRNGVYEQVVKAAGGRKLVEFSGIEPNPRYETLMRAVELVGDLLKRLCLCAAPRVPHINPHLPARRPQ